MGTDTTGIVVWETSGLGRLVVWSERLVVWETSGLVWETSGLRLVVWRLVHYRQTVIPWANNLRRGRPDAVVDQPRQAEVAHLGVQRGIQHDVAWLDVTVHYTLLPLCVEVRQRRAEADDDLVRVDRR